MHIVSHMFVHSMDKRLLESLNSKTVIHALLDGYSIAFPQLYTQAKKLLASFQLLIQRLLRGLPTKLCTLIEKVGLTMALWQGAGLVYLAYLVVHLFSCA